MTAAPDGRHDLHELLELVREYARTVDTRQPDATAALFAPDGVLCRAGDPDGRFTRRGRDEIAAAMAQLERYESTSHVLGEPRLVLDADGRSASGTTPCEAHHVWSDATGRHDKVMTITYEDRFVRAADAGGERWRFAERRLVVDDERVVALG